LKQYEAGLKEFLFKSDVTANASEVDCYLYQTNTVSNNI